MIVRLEGYNRVLLCMVCQCIPEKVRVQSSSRRRLGTESTGLISAAKSKFEYRMCKASIER